MTLESVLAFYTGWFLVTLIWSKMAKENPVERGQRFKITFFIVTIFYLLLHL